MKRFIIILMTILIIFTLFQGASRENVVKANETYQWVPINNGLYGTIVKSLVIDPKNTNIIYAGTDLGHGVFKSINSGSSWSSINNGLTNSWIHSLVIDPKNTNIIYAGTDIGGVFKSTNGGSNWTQMNTGLTNPVVYSLAIDPTNTQVIYAGTQGGAGSQGVFKSTNGGNSWIQLNKQLKYLWWVTSIAIDQTNTQIIYAGSYGSGVSKSINGGDSWSQVNNGITDLSVTSIAIDQTNTQIIYAGIEEGGVSKSTNGGDSWSAINNGLISEDSKKVKALAIDPTNTQIIYAGTEGGVFKSTNGGENWSEMNNGLKSPYYTQNVQSLAIDPTDTNIIYVGTYSGIFKYMFSPIITASAGAGGTISPSGTVTVNYGESQTFSITSNTGYHIKDVKVDGTSVGAISTYAFNNITADHTIEATFEVNTYAIQTSATIGGLISPSGTITVNSGDSKTFTITPYSGYKISDVKVDGVSKGSVSSYAFTDITSNHTISTTFEKEITQTVIILQIGKTSFTVNGVSSTLDSPPVIKNSRTLLPIRAVVEALGGTVGWEASLKIVTINLGSHNLSLQIGSSKATVDNKFVQIDSTNPKVVPEIINSRTMLPLRFVAENLGCSVDWDGTTKTITITYQGR